MKRILSLVGTITLILVAVVFALQTSASHPVLERAQKALPGKPRVAVLVEFGAKDVTGRDWSGQATVSGAKVVDREGYRFRDADKLVGANGWQVKTRPPIRAPKGQPAVTKLEPVATVGVVMHLEAVEPDAAMTITLEAGGKGAGARLADILAGKTISLWDGAAVVRRVTTAQPLAAGPTEEDFPAAAYGPDGTLWVAYTSYKHRDEKRRIEAPQLKEQPKNFKDFYKPELADQLLVRSFKDGKWSEPIVLSSQSDIARCAISVTRNGDVHVVYSIQNEDSFALFRRVINSEGKLENVVEAMTDVAQWPRNLSPVMTTDSKGNYWVAAQSWNPKGQASIVVRHPRGLTVLEGKEGENCWHPAIAASPTGQVAVAYDIYHHGNYDVRLAVFDPKAKEPQHVTVASTPKLEARPSIVYDPLGRLWIAYEEGPEKWGKDYGAFVPDKGKPLYNERSVRVVCLDIDGLLKKATAELPTSRYDPPVLPFEPVKTAKYERTTRYAYPSIGIDGQGRVWLAYRHNFGNRYSSHNGAYWLTFVRRLDGQVWSEPIEVHHSDGLLDSRPVLLPHAGGGLLVVHNTDGRYSTPEKIDNQIYASVIDLPAKATVLQLVEQKPGENKPSPDVKQENASVKQMRQHRVKTAGKTYQYLRGEYHRHTEISWDGAPDGSLEDMFRYAIDAAQMDWIGNGDHDNGAGREYSWWLTQKFTDAYHVPKAFTTMFTYERSVPYPHGHRNVMFAQRGILTLPRLAAPDEPGPEKGGKWPGNVHPDDAKMLYRYLHEFGGICASHTSATSMGTDWRDNDPAVEPIVEIYQGDRMSYEMEGAPRSGFDPQSGKTPANVAGWFPKGYVNLALQKGYKLAFQASSDHWSTHISFFIILAEGRDRKQLLDAVKKRHCYAATDNILVDFRCGDHIMGDELTTMDAPKFQIHIAGTDALGKVEILRDSEVVDSIGPAQANAILKKEWTDTKAPGGTHYYYVRVVQANGEIAWGSPIWVTVKK